MDGDRSFKRVANELLKAYAKKDPAFMQIPVTYKPDSWIQEAIVLTATAAVEALEALSQHGPANRGLWRNLIINRIIRGVLWTIHNGNAPGRDPLAEDQFRRNEDRSLECSLNSRWLVMGTTIYIS